MAVKFFGRWLLCILLWVAAAGADAQQRITTSIDNGWQFHKGELTGFPAIKDASTTWEQVNLPHTWNTTDVADDSPGYYRGVGWYTKKIFINPSWHNKAVYVYFEGASQVAEVYINGRKAGTHIGGYTGFAFPITQYLSFGDTTNPSPNEISVWVDNSHNEDIPPLSADFTFYGGIYRSAYLVATDSVHINMDDHAAPGIVVSTPFVSPGKASVQVKGAVTNSGFVPKNISVLTRIVDAEGNLIDRRLSTLQALPGNTPFAQLFETVSSPQLWSIEHPYLYRVITTVQEDASGRILDVVNQPLGFRWFRFDADGGFFLNGQHVKLIGTNRHQDYKDMGNAVPDVLQVKDLELLKAMGGNFIRIAHYPQDPSILEACDRMGIVASVETPVVNRITETPGFAQNSKNMQVEMIRQNINHPSVFIWAYMNEVLLVPRYDPGTAERNAYYGHVYELAKELDSITRQEDSTRYTMLPAHGNFNVYHDAHLTNIPMIMGWNLYPGWYSGEFADFPKFLDMHHRILPNKPMIVSEFGADADERLHSFAPERFDKTEEYASRYHRAYLPAIRERDFVAGAAIWNLVEFNSEGRTEATPHINTKGLMTANREPKAAYYYYQSQLVQYPYVQIGSANWRHRAGVAVGDSALYCIQPVEIYTNQPEIIVRHNGVLLDTVTTENGVATVEVPFTDGRNEIEAIAPNHHDTLLHSMAILQFKLVPADLKSTVLPFTDIHVSLGDKRYFTDNLTGVTWLPERAYKAGSFGYTGGKVFTLGKSSSIPYGSNRNILNTTLDPLYQTQRSGLDYFRADVPNGIYAVTLHFCELLSNKEQETLAYNLGNDKGNSKQERFTGGRQFNVWINDLQMLQGLGNNTYLQPLQPYQTTVRVEVTDGKGIVVNFMPVKGESILNAIEIVRL